MLARVISAAALVGVTSRSSSSRRRLIILPYYVNNMQSMSQSMSQSRTSSSSVASASDAESTNMSLSGPPPIKNILHDLDAIGRTTENTFLRGMIPESTPPTLSLMPREVTAHYVIVEPESSPAPKLVVASKSCSEMIGLDPCELDTQRFANAMTGNELLPGLQPAYATPYGCHSFGQWFGQLGDGRAMSLGEVLATPVPETATIEANEACEAVIEDGEPHRYELQLKGCGRTPFARGFDGRAVLRSCVREFLGRDENKIIRILRV
jgi:hypothetical protein